LLPTLIMTEPTQSGMTILLNRWQRGDEAAFARVLDQAMNDLEKMAASRMRGEDRATIQPDDLLNEALVRMLESRGADNAKSETANTNGDAWKNRAHFFATMSLHMRSILVDRARARKADKRGGGAIHVTLSNALDAEESMVTDLIALDETLKALAAVDARGAEILHLTYFAGLTREEIADVMQVSVPTVDRELRFARAWLSEQLGHDIS
jgi:RNA polymerase sigma factor (TIGR02999 family)